MDSIYIDRDWLDSNQTTQNGFQKSNVIARHISDLCYHFSLNKNHLPSKIAPLLAFWLHFTSCETIANYSIIVSVFSMRTKE